MGAMAGRLQERERGCGVLEVSQPRVTYLSQRGYGFIDRELRKVQAELNVSDELMMQIKNYFMLLQTISFGLKNELRKVPKAFVHSRKFIKEEYPEVLVMEQKIEADLKQAGLDQNSREVKNFIELSSVWSLKQLARDVKLPGMLQKIKEKLNR